MLEKIEVLGGGMGRPRVTRTATMWLLLGALSLGGACSRNSKEDVAAEPVPVTELKVENRAFLDMTIFVYRNSQRVRLGIANGNSTVKFVIPANLLFGSTPLRFQADPIGRNRQPVTQEISVSPGDEVNLIIPPS
jgi:hypothetical protein